MSVRLRAFRHRNYRLFFGGQAVSLVGTWMQQVAQGWLVLQLTGDPLWLGVVASAQFGPVVVLGLFGGLLADQLPKRPTLIATQAVAMVLALMLFALTALEVVEVWHVIVLALGLGITNSFDMPARQAFSIEMVGREDVPNAVGFNSALFNASRIFGPALAGILIAVFDLSIAFLLNGLSYGAVIAAYLAMRAEELRPAPTLARSTSVSNALANLAEGIRYVRHTPVVLLAVTVLFLGASFGMNFQVLIPPLADDTLDVGASGYGFLMAASGVGSTVAALAVAMSRRARLGMIGLGALALGLGLVVLGWSTWFPLSLAMMAVSGAGAISMAVTGNTTMQLVVPDMLRGRVMSVWTTAFSASVPVGGLLMGAIASAWDAPTALVVGGVLTAAVGAAGLVWTRRIGATERLTAARAAGRPVSEPPGVADEAAAVSADGLAAEAVPATGVRDFRSSS